ncbi:MAG: MBOAT family protein [Hyphomonadaceae bacterium]|nr:MBOAT family protein [Hyphomonadaceae bacterium]
MLFNSNAFLLLLLPLAFAAHRLALRSRTAQAAIAVLVVASVAFYVSTNAAFAGILFASILFNYAAGLALARHRSRLLLIIAICANLGLLGYFKYANFAIENVNALFGATYPALEIALPVGISFYTFTQLTYLVDAYVGKAKEKDILAYGLFVTFFPHLIAGPIMHHAQMMPQFKRKPAQARLASLAPAGLFLLGVGLVKKLYIADPLSTLASPMFDGAAQGIDPNFFSAWVGAFAYAFQIYFDFSGYCDMAVGLALLFGIRLPANFNSPYKSTSIIAFWRRWHMTLSRLLRDYVYIPLGGNRRGVSRRYLNLMTTMLVGGVWHGASWNFVVWGGVHGLLLALNHAWNALPFVRGGFRAPWLFGPLTFLAVTLAWVPFRAVDGDSALRILETMAGAHGLAAPLELDWLLRRLGVDLSSFGVAIVAENERRDHYLALATMAAAAIIAFCAPNALQIAARYRPTADFAADVASDWSSDWRRKRQAWRFAPGVRSGVLVGAMIVAALMAVNAARPSEFLYFQF